MLSSAVLSDPPCVAVVFRSADLWLANLHTGVARYWLCQKAERNRARPAFTFRAAYSLCSPMG